MHRAKARSQQFIEDFVEAFAVHCATRPRKSLIVSGSSSHPSDSLSYPWGSPRLAVVRRWARRTERGIKLHQTSGADYAHNTQRWTSFR